MLVILYLVQFSLFVSASENGKYYACDTSKWDTECIFKATVDAPFSEAKPHNIVRGTDPKRQVATEQGVALNVSPKPWTNGDKFIDTQSEVTGDVWNYALAFDLVAPLRDVLMYTPSVVATNKTKWDIYTKAFTDCGIKTEDTEAEHGIALGTDSVYEKLTNYPAGTDIHHNILQYLEEGAIDLVCLVTSLEMPARCDPIREKMGTTKGNLCNCFFDAYVAMYGAQPTVPDDSVFLECTSAPPDPTTSTGSDSTPTAMSDVSSPTAMSDVSSPTMAAPTTMESPTAKHIDGDSSSEHSPPPTTTSIMSPTQVSASVKISNVLETISLIVLLGTLLVQF